MDAPATNDEPSTASQPNTPRNRNKKGTCIVGRQSRDRLAFLGKQKWVPLPLDGAEGDATVAPTTLTETQAKTSPGKGTPRASRSSRGGRGGHRHRTRSLDGLVAKRNRKNRPAAATHQAYQDYQSYYCEYR